MNVLRLFISFETASCLKSYNLICVETITRGEKTYLDQLRYTYYTDGEENELVILKDDTKLEDVNE